MHVAEYSGYIFLGRGEEEGSVFPAFGGEEDAGIVIFRTEEEGFPILLLWENVWTMLRQKEIIYAAKKNKKIF